MENPRKERLTTRKVVFGVLGAVGVAAAIGLHNAAADGNALARMFSPLTPVIEGAQQLGELTAPEASIVCPQEGGTVMTPSECD